MLFVDNLIGWCYTSSNFFSVVCRRWANVGPPVKKPLGQRRQPTSGRRMCRSWPDVGPTSECYLGSINIRDLCPTQDMMPLIVSRSLFFWEDLI